MSKASIEILQAACSFFEASASRGLQGRRAGPEVLEIDLFHLQELPGCVCRVSRILSSVGSNNASSSGNSTTRHPFLRSGTLLRLGVSLDMPFDKGDCKWGLYGFMSAFGIGTIVSGVETLGHDRWNPPYIW